MSTGAVTLAPHDPDWAALARAETARMEAALGADLCTVHHIGSTSIAGLRAKRLAAGFLSGVAAFGRRRFRRHPVTEAVGVGVPDNLTARRLDGAAVAMDCWFVVAVAASR